METGKSVGIPLRHSAESLRRWLTDLHIKFCQPRACCPPAGEKLNRFTLFFPSGFFELQIEFKFIRDKPTRITGTTLYMVRQFANANLLIYLRLHPKRRTDLPARIKGKKR